MNIVIINCFDTWEHRADLLYKILVQDGHRVSVLQSDFRHTDKQSRTKQKKDYIFFPAKPYTKNLSLARLQSHMQLSRDIFLFADRQAGQIDLMWVFAPPNSFVRGAGMVKKKHPHIKLIIDFIDLWPETMPVHSLKKLPVFYVWKNIRDKYLPYADCVMTECELYQQVLGKAVCGMDVRTLYLAREDQGYKPHLHLPEDRTALCYLGSINHIIDIDTIADIIRMCRKKQPVLFHIIGDGEKKHVLVKAAEAAGAKVFCHGIVYDRKRKQQIFDSCHYGLNIMKKSVCIGLTMKSIDYFEFGLPIINNIPGDTWNAVEKYGIGLNWNSSAEVNTENSSGRKQARKFFETYLTESVFCASVRNCI